MLEKVVKYMFSSDYDWANRTMYCVELCKNSYISEVMNWKPYVRHACELKHKAFWMSKPVAEDYCRKVMSVGYLEAKTKKIHWWDVMLREMHSK